MEGSSIVARGLAKFVAGMEQAMPGAQEVREVFDAVLLPSLWLLLQIMIVWMFLRTWDEDHRNSKVGTTAADPSLPCQQNVDLSTSTLQCQSRDDAEVYCHLDFRLLFV